MQFPLLESLPADARHSLIERARRQQFARQEVVVHEGGPSDSLHLVHSGRLAAQVSTPQGQIAMLSLILPGDSFGEVSLLDDGASRRSATVIALEPAETWSISRSTFQALQAAHPAMRQLVAIALAERVNQLTGRLLDALYEGLDRRVYRSLVYLCEVYAVSPADPHVAIPLTQEMLAEFAGGTRPSVNLVLQGLQASGLVELARGRIVVLDRPGLAELIR